jgi:1-acyl-sn-glycerol-3-phosphate acyltransferase
MNPADAQTLTRRWGEAVVRGLLESVWGLRVTGLERVPRDGPLLVACNHVSLADGPVLCSALGLARRPRFLGKRELFDIPLLGSFLLAGGAIPLDRSGSDPSALRAALEILEKGGSVGLFPEGTRVKPGQTRKPKAGVAFLAARSGAPVLPVRLFGTAEFPRVFPLEVRFGAPLTAPRDEGREAAEEFARAVMDAVYAL